MSGAERGIGNLPLVRAFLPESSILDALARDLFFPSPGPGGLVECLVLVAIAV